MELLRLLALLRNFLAGKKTYLISLSALLALLTAWADNKVETEKFIEQAVALVIAMTLRAGVHAAANTAEKPKPPQPPKAEKPSNYWLSNGKDDGIRIHYR